MLSIDASYSTLSSEELLRKVIPSYNVGQVKDCIFWERGFNDTYKIVGPDRNYILRVYGFGRRTLENIKYEIDVLLYLNNKSVNVSCPISRTDGEYVTTIATAEGLRYAILTTYAEGVPFVYESVDDSYLYGVHVAKIHACSEGFVSKYSRPKLDELFLVAEPLSFINNFKNIKPEDLQFINKFSSTLLAHIRNSKGLDYGFCHGDFHGWNAHRLSHDVEFFDFDFCGYGLRTYDLSVFRWGARRRGNELEQWDAFIRGYSSIRKITEDDLNLTKFFVGIRDIWLIGQHINYAKVHGQNFLNTQYFAQRIEFLKKLDAELCNDTCNT